MSPPTPTAATIPPSPSASKPAASAPAPVPDTYTLPPDAVWFITGCSSGLGLSLARHVLAASPTHRLVATARDARRRLPLELLLPAAEAAAEADGGDGGCSSRVLVLDLDVTSPGSVTAALDAVLAHPGFGRIDVLVNNAGYGLNGDTESTLPSSPDEHAKARRLLETNFWGVAHLTLHAMRIMREDNARPSPHASSSGQQGGVVVQITSMGGFVGYPGGAYYHAAKFAVEGFTESVSREVRPEWNIHFTIAEPGGIDTNYATSSLVMLADHPAYTAPDCPTRKLLSYIENPEFRKSWSKPDNMAAAIYEVVSRGKKIPIRFPLGAMSWEALRGEVDAMAREFDDIKELSIGVDTVEQAEGMKKVKQFF